MPFIITFHPAENSEQKIKIIFEMSQISNFIFASFFLAIYDNWNSWLQLEILVSSAESF